MFTESDNYIILFYNNSLLYYIILYNSEYYYNNIQDIFILEAGLWSHLRILPTITV